MVEYHGCRSVGPTKIDFKAVGKTVQKPLNLIKPELQRIC